MVRCRRTFLQLEKAKYISIANNSQTVDGTPETKIRGGQAVNREAARQLKLNHKVQIYSQRVSAQPRLQCT